MRNNYFLTFIMILLMTIVMSYSYAEGRDPAIEKMDLSTVSGVEAHIKKELAKTISLIVKPSRFIVEARVSVRANRRVKAQTFYLGKLGAQPKSSGQDTIIQEKITDRITKVEIDLYLHPLVEAGKKNIIVSLIQNSTPFVTPSKIELNLQTMQVLPESFVWDEYVDNIQYWGVANKRIFKIIGWIFFGMFLIFGIGRLSWKLARKKYKEVRAFIDHRVEELKNFGTTEAQNSNDWRAKISSQMKLFNVHTKGLSRRKALIIKKWLYKGEADSDLVLSALPELMGESEFMAVFKLLPSEHQNKWQDKISNILWEKEEYKIFEFLQENNMESLKQTHSADEWSLAESCVDLNVEQVGLLLEKSKKYALPLANVISSTEWKEILSFVSEEKRTQITASAFSNNSAKFEFKSEEFDKVKTRVLNIYSAESQKLEKLEILAASINVKDEKILQDIIRGCKNVDKVHSIVRNVMPQSLLLNLSEEIYVPILSMVPVKERVKFIMALNEDIRNKVLLGFDKRMGDSGRIVRQELALLEQNEILSVKIKNEPSEYCGDVFKIIRNELKEKDHLYNKIEYKVQQWIQQAMKTGDKDVDKVA